MNHNLNLSHDTELVHFGVVPVCHRVDLFIVACKTTKLFMCIALHSTFNIRLSHDKHYCSMFILQQNFWTFYDSVSIIHINPGELYFYFRTISILFFEWLCVTIMYRTPFIPITIETNYMRYFMSCGMNDGKCVDEKAREKKYKKKSFMVATFM